MLTNVKTISAELLFIQTIKFLNKINQSIENRQCFMALPVFIKCIKLKYNNT